MFSHLDLTFVWVTPLDVSGDADNSQSVDACEAEKQRQETIYLKENRERSVKYERTVREL